MLLLLSLHVHHQRMAVEVDCYQCAHHQPHAGHITAVQDVMHDCLVCQLQGQSFLPADEVGQAVLAPEREEVVVVQRLTQPGEVVCLRLRGPPAV